MSIDVVMDLYFENTQNIYQREISMPVPPAPRMRINLGGYEAEVLYVEYDVESGILMAHMDLFPGASDEYSGYMFPSEEKEEREFMSKIGFARYRPSLPANRTKTMREAMTTKATDVTKTEAGSPGRATGYTADDKEVISKAIVEVSYMAARLSTIVGLIEEHGKYEHLALKAAAESVAEARDDLVLSYHDGVTSRAV